MILLDTGPLVAMIDGSDRYHAACSAVVKLLREPMVTVWPSIAEAMYLLGAHELQNDLWDLLEQPVVAIEGLTRSDFSRMRELMRKYRDLPMDLADAGLVVIAERTECMRVFTLDRRDFEVYRVRGRKFDIIP